jgi:hypothetical protein
MEKNFLSTLVGVIFSASFFWLTRVNRLHLYKYGITSMGDIPETRVD